MINVKFTVNQQTLQRIGNYKLIQDSKNFVQLDFQFYDKSWNDVVKTVIFKTADGKVYSVIMESNSVVVPEACLTAAFFSVSVMGNDVDNDIRITTNAVELSLGESGYAEGETPPEPSLTVYEQILQKCEEAVDTANDVQQRADNGEFKGEPFTYDDLTDEQRKAFFKDANVLAKDITADFYERTKTVQEYLDGLDVKANKAQSKANEAATIAKGRATGYVFDTEYDMMAWLMDESNLPQLNLGDNFYIREVSVPDYWWDGAWISPLETQKVDLSEYMKAPEPDKGGYYVVPIMQGNGTQNSLRMYNAPLQYAVPLYGTGGVLSTNAPTDALHCVNKKYLEENYRDSEYVDNIGAATAMMVNKFEDIDELVLPDMRDNQRVPSTYLLGRVVDAAKNASTFEEFKANLSALNAL